MRTAIRIDNEFNLASQNLIMKKDKAIPTVTLKKRNLFLSKYPHAMNK